MKKIELTRGKFTLVDDEDFEYLSRWHWCYDRYAKRGGRVGEGVKTIYLHRQLMGAPSNLEVDHINGNLLDNRKRNLRICTHQCNLANSRRAKDNRSGYKGVCWDKEKGKWMARIVVDYKDIHLGYFTNAQRAAIAYNMAAKRHFGEYAKINNL